MKRKRLEAWGEVLNGRLAAVHRDRKIVESWAHGDEPVCGPARVVRLVEYSPAETALVRAVRKWLSHPYPHSTEGTDLWLKVNRAVQRLHKRQRNP